jgi:hypothetical protein
MDRVLPLHEPIVTGWFIELASFALVLFVGVVIAQEVAEYYKGAAILTERAGSMERLYVTQQAYFEAMKQDMEDTKKLRHDIRHHFTVIDGYVRSRQYEALSAYVSEYQTSFTAFVEHEPFNYCPINVINVLAFHYDMLSAQNNIHFDLRHDIHYDLCHDISFDPHHNISPDDSNKCIASIPDTDLCSLFSNLMENAVEACRRIETGERYIRVAVVSVDKGHLMIRVQNSTDENPRQDGETFLSSKAVDRKGYGLSSITSIAKKYGGSASFHWDKTERVFESRAYLMRINDTRGRFSCDDFPRKIAQREPSP